MLNEYIDLAISQFYPGPLELTYTTSSGYVFGAAIAKATLQLLDVQSSESGTSQDDYTPPGGPGIPYKYFDEPTNPVRLVLADPNDPNPNGPMIPQRVYHAPFYGATSRRLAIQKDHIIADPPADPSFTGGAIDEYEDSVKDVHRMGGATALNTTKRRPEQTAVGHFWAYDGANLIGTAPRNYNQILRDIAWSRRLDKSMATSDRNNADFARLFALVNVAMADAGIISWREKYHFEFWRPLSGIRQDNDRTDREPQCILRQDQDNDRECDDDTDPMYNLADPFWLILGAPDTNSNHTSIKPPFPSYPSAHATFGSAAFQMIRRFYNDRDKLNLDIAQADNIEFEYVSDELNGINRQLYQDYVRTAPIESQPGDVRTKVVRHFASLWEAMLENALSRNWLGVHWRFDAFAAEDVLVPKEPNNARDKDSLYHINEDGTTAYKRPTDVMYQKKAASKRRPDEGSVFDIGGVPLGINIANDIYDSQLMTAPDAVQPPNHGGPAPPVA